MKHPVLVSVVSIYNNGGTGKRSQVTTEMVMVKWSLIIGKLAVVPTPNTLNALNLGEVLATLPGERLENHSTLLILSGSHVYHKQKVSRCHVRKVVDLLL